MKAKYVVVVRYEHGCYKNIADETKHWWKWAAIIDAMAMTLAYVLCNRMWVYVDEIGNRKITNERLRIKRQA